MGTSLRVERTGSDGTALTLSVNQAMQLVTGILRARRLLTEALPPWGASPSNIPLPVRKHFTGVHIVTRRMDLPHALFRHDYDLCRTYVRPKNYKYLC